MSSDICINSLGYVPVGSVGKAGTIGIVRFIASIVSILVSLCTILWIKRNEIAAQQGNVSAVKSVIFPVFVPILWLTALLYLYYSLLIVFLSFPVNDTNPIVPSVCYALMSAVQHAITEGIAFLLMQKGCGQHATSTAFVYTIVWACSTFTIVFVAFWKAGESIDILSVLWDLLILIFYLILWLAPQRHLFRRPAAVLYAKFWAVFRLASIVINIFFFSPKLAGYAVCGYLLVWFILFPCLQPVICYWTLLQDSRWWQGLDIRQGTRRPSDEDIRSPLIGTDFSLECAQSLATSMDRMRRHCRVKMLNFACIRIDLDHPLGSGSFSKVYRGTYRMRSYAIKVIYTVDLTVDVIRRVSAEASILSSIKHPNVVSIIGVSVLPPSVCLILELCSYGSLSDVIRGCGFDWNKTLLRPPLNLSLADKIHLARGCARGLSAIHELDPLLCHRDVKSFNFLVDHQLTAKIADLELGTKKWEVEEETHSRSSWLGLESDYEPVLTHDKEDPEDQVVIVEDFLANWMAPEVITSRQFRQPADVYSLAVVMWEIVTGELPFAEGNLSQSEIRQKVLSGFRHQIPMVAHKCGWGKLIEKAWSEDPNERPAAKEIANLLSGMLAACCYDLVLDTETAPDLSTAVSYYYNTRTSSTPKFSSQLSTHSSYDTSDHSVLIKMLINEPNNVFSSIQEAITMIHNDSCWDAMEENGQAWVVVTSYPPFLIVYSTTSWTQLFMNTKRNSSAEFALLALDQLIADDADMHVATNFFESLSTAHQGHCVLNFSPPQQGSMESKCCSVHAFPVYYRSIRNENREYLNIPGDGPPPPTAGRIPYLALLFTDLNGKSLESAVMQMSPFAK